MPSRPVIFISMVSEELRSSRDLVAKTLLSLGFEPKWRDFAPTENGDRYGVLRKPVDESAGVIHLVGHAYGPELWEPDAEFGRVSCVQYEALYARKCGKKVWHLFIDEGFVPDPHEPEPEEQCELQRQYSERIRATGVPIRSFSSPITLEAAVLLLRDELPKSRRGRNLRTALVLFSLSAVTAGALHFIKGRQQIATHSFPPRLAVEPVDETLALAVERREKIEQALARLPGVEMNARQPGEEITPAELRQRALAILDDALALPAGTLATELPAVAVELSGKPDLPLPLRARAAYALNNFEDAEKLFLESEALDKSAPEDAEHTAAMLRSRRIEALEGAAVSAVAQAQFQRAISHTQSAAALTDSERDPLEWARIQHELASVRSDLADDREAARLLPPVIEIRQRVLGPEAPDTLTSRGNLARALQNLGSYPEAETEYRAVLEIRQRVPGPEHPDTIGSRSNLAFVLLAQKNFTDAATEHRAVLAIRERVPGPDHPDTLASRNALALALRGQGKLDEAEAEFRTVLAIRTRVVGAEHPLTLSARDSVALVLGARGEHAEAEAEFRALLAILQRVLGPEHPEALITRDNLAIALGAQGKFTDAEAQQRVALDIRGRVFGPDHPDTVSSRKRLAITLASEHKYAEAEREFRIVTSDEQRLLGPDDPATLNSRNSLAGMLLNLDRPAEAEAEFRALLPTIERVLGPEHPDTLGCRSNLANALQRLGKFPEAVAEQKAVLEIQERIHGAEHPDVFMSCFNLAISLEAQAIKADALAFARRAWEGQRKLLGADHPVTQECRKMVQDLERR